MPSKSKQKPKGLARTQVFTPPWMTHAMLDLLDPAVLAEEEAKFFEPSCGNGQMLEVIVDRLYQAMLATNGGNQERALAAACVRWFAIELDPTLVTECRQRLYDALWKKARDCDREKLCQWLIAWLVHQRIACTDFFEFMKGQKGQPELTLPWEEPPTERDCVTCGRPFLAGIARWCPACRPDRMREVNAARWAMAPRKYPWTADLDQRLRDRYDSRVKHRAAEIAASFGWPVWQIKRRASALGLSTPWPADRRDWTPEEERILEENVGRRHVNWLSKKLKRSLSSVVLKIKRSGLRQRVTDGYTLRGLQECFGCDHHTIERWVRDGKLHVRRRNPEAGSRSPWFVTDRNVLDFIRQHPLDFRLDKVDQHWFLDLVLGTSFLRRHKPEEVGKVEAE